MLDVILGAYLAWLAVRGWTRGLIREALSLVGLILGTFLAFRLGGVVGDFLSRSFGWPPEVSRIAGGVVLFVLLGVVLSVAAAALSRVMRLPGLNLANRLGGSALAVIWALALMLVVVNVARVLPFPESWDDQVERSVLVDAVAGPDAWPQRIFHRVAGDSVLATLYSLQNLFGSERVVPRSGQQIAFPPVPPDEIRQVRAEAEMILQELNRHRTAAEAALLAPSDVLVDLAELRASDSYASGILSRDPDCVPEADSRVGVRLVRCSEAVALASTSLAALDAMLGDDEVGRVVLGDDYDRAGVAVIDGPTGRLVMIVLAG